MSTFDRLWRCLPFLRPMVTIIGDSLGGNKYGIDAVGGRVHDLLGTRCDAYGKSTPRIPANFGIEMKSILMSR